MVQLYSLDITLGDVTMHTATNLLKEHVPQAQSAAIVKVKTARLNYLDTLKVILIILVIALHTAITYGALGGWPYTDPVQDEMTSILLTMVTGLVQAFSLGLYFFVSGYFTPGSYDRKGLRRFWKDRLLRLAIPLMLYTFVLSRIVWYIVGVAQGNVSDSFWVFFRQTFITHAEEGPTWFIFALLLFSAGYTLWRLATRSTSPAALEWTRNMKLPGKKEILGFGLLISVLMFVIGLKFPVNDTWEVFGIFSLMIIFFAQYILFFIAGILAHRNDWLRKFDGKDLHFWAWLSLGFVLLMPVLFVVGGAADGAGDFFLGGFYWQSAAFMLWIGLFSVSISMALILSLRDRKKPQGHVMAFAGPNSYGVYLIHPLILVPISVGFSYLPIFPLLKFAIVLPLVVVLCFLVAEGLRRIPGVNAIL
jgi:glucans biosynthesis protein C